MLVRKQAASGAHLFQQLLVLARIANSSFPGCPAALHCDQPRKLCRQFISLNTLHSFQQHHLRLQPIPARHTS